MTTKLTPWQLPVFCVLIERLFLLGIDLRYVHTCAERTRAEAGEKLASTQIITCVHTWAVAERRRSGSKIRSATHGSQFSASASKPRAPNDLCPQEMADPPASARRICEHTRGSGVGISKSARLHSVTPTLETSGRSRFRTYLRVSCYFIDKVVAANLQRTSKYTMLTFIDCFPLMTTSRMYLSPNIYVSF